jgi:hypothetical protein
MRNGLSRRHEMILSEEPILIATPLLANYRGYC